MVEILFNHFEISGTGGAAGPTAGNGRFEKDGIVVKKGETLFAQVDDNSDS